MQYIDWVCNEKNIGKIKKADIIIKYDTNQCNDTFNLYIKLDEKKEKIIDCKYKVYGCPGLLAGIAITSEIIKNKTIKEIKEITNENILQNIEKYPTEKEKCILSCINCIKDNI